MRIGYLGPLEVHGDDGVVPVPGQRLRLLVLRLAVAAGRPVPAGRLAEAVWGDDQPADPANALQSLVSRLRRTLGDAGVVEQSATGYRLAVAPDDVDAVRFARLVAEGRRLMAESSYGAAAGVLDEALSLWRGEPLADDTSPDGEAERVRLDDLRLQAGRDRAEADVRTGHAEAAVPLLESMVTAHPLREDVVLVLMDALVAAGRPAEALAVFERTRETLADTLGSDPSPALQARHLEVLRAQDAPAVPSTNLRAAVTTFVGRRDDVRAVGDRLVQGRLVTLVGAGGSGKTRLATEVATAVLAGGPGLPAAPDGVWFAELAPVTDPDDLALALLDALGARDVMLLDQSSDRQPRSSRDRLVAGLADARALLVVDNCEHVVDAAADVVAELLARCPGVRVLATSREPLGIDGELLYPLSPLAVPPEDADPATAAESPAVRLLVDRALAVGTRLVLDDDTVGPVVQVVRRLDGLPLAIELAAARLRVLTVDEVAERLTDRFRLLTGGRRTAMPRHRTLRAVVEWSWDLLTEEEREVAEHFAVLGSGATAEAVAAVCPRWRDDAAPDLGDVTDLLHALVDKSLLVAEHGAHGTRYRMLETLREYGAERLANAGTITAARAAHARHYAALVERADPMLRTDQQVHWLRVLDVERDNVLTALGFLCDRGDTDAAIALAVRLTWYWMLRANGTDSTRWLRAALDVPGADRAPMHAVAEAMDVMASFAMPTEEPVEQPVRRDPAAIVADLAAYDGPDSALVTLMHPLMLFVSGQREQAREVLAHHVASEDPWVRAAARTVRLSFAENDGDLDAVRADLEQALADWTEIGDRWGIASVLGARGQLRTVEGDLAGAAEDQEAALAHLMVLGGGGDDLMVNMRLADLRLRLGDVDGARRYLATMRAEHQYREMGLLRDLLADVMAVHVALVAGDEAEVHSSHERLLKTLASQATGMAAAHGSAVGLAAAALVEAGWGELADAREHLREGYRLGLQTEDLPIISATGVASAQLAYALGDPREAAVRLGASARLRGADDATQPAVARLTARLRTELADGFAPAYDEGRTLGRQEALDRIDPAHLPAAPAEGGSAAGQARRR